MRREPVPSPRKSCACVLTQKLTPHLHPWLLMLIDSSV